MIAAGVIIALFLRRIVWAAGLARTLVIWGIVTLTGACKNIATLNGTSAKLRCRSQLEENWKKTK